MVTYSGVSRYHLQVGDSSVPVCITLFYVTMVTVVCLAVVPLTHQMDQSQPSKYKIIREESVHKLVNPPKNMLARTLHKRFMFLGATVAKLE